MRIDDRNLQAAPPVRETGFLGRIFRLGRNRTTVKTEVIAGITMFMTMAYILAVNPSILSVAGIPRGGVFVATALAAVVGTLLMAVLSNYPFVLAPGMGLNAFLTFGVCKGMGYSWQFALLALVFAPVFLAIPAFATAPALIIVGCMMLSSAVEIDFSDPGEAFPAFLTIVGMPFAYSVSEGIMWGIISYTLVNLIAGRARKIHWIMYVLTLLFIAKYALM